MAIAGGVAAAIALATPAWAGDLDPLTAYARARAADAAGDSVAAAGGYRDALRADPGNTAVASRAYRAALVAGDMALVRTAAAVLRTAGSPPPDAALLDIADAVRVRDWAAVEAAADRLGKGPIDFLAPAVRAWVAFERKAGDPLATLDIEATNALARRFNRENHALLLIATGREDQGVAELRPLLGTGSENASLRVTAAQLLARRGKDSAARLLLPADQPDLKIIRDRLGRGARADAAFGISRLFVRLAGDLVAGDARPLAMMLCRAALEIDPSDDRARLTLAGALSNGGAQEGALALLGAIRPDSPYATTARAMAITTMSRGGGDARALAAAQAAAAAPGAGSDDLQRLGDRLVAVGRQADAAAAYAAAMERGGADDWALNLQRGGALEQAGRWSEALPFLRRAVELAPEQAQALNHLGYAQAERGENLVEAQALLERAARLDPDDAAITDSLGWAYVRSGRVRQAVPLLERAARAEPGDATINEHLGDAYWALGRRYEARYAWRAATVGANDADAARLAQKLAIGIATP